MLMFVAGCRKGLLLLYLCFVFYGLPQRQCSSHDSLRHTCKVFMCLKAAPGVRPMRV